MQPLERYLRHLTVERGLSKNTLAAYGSDLARYLDYLERLSTRPEQVSSNQVGDFAQQLTALGLKASSANRILAAVRGFH
ncbi:MAG: site-specific integrase, partial [Aquiluna sp.]